MITFSKYTDIVQSISKKLKVSKDQAVNALIKAQQKGINPLKWQKHITMLKQFVQIVAHKEDTQKEFFTLGVNKPTKDQIQDYLDRLGSALRLLSNKDIIRTVERYFKTIKNLKLDHGGRKVLSFEELEIKEYVPSFKTLPQSVKDVYKILSKKDWVLKQPMGDDRVIKLLKKYDDPKKVADVIMKKHPLLKDEKVDEDRDYKDEYKKFQSSEKMRKYRAELNKYNRDKGTYGNGDGKDASHKDGKIVGMEDQSVNRGRAEKSRLIGSKRK